MNNFNHDKSTSLLIFIYVLFGIACIPYQVLAVEYSFESGMVYIKLPAPMGEIQAVNNVISGYVEPKTGTMKFNVSVDSFRFVTPFMPDYVNVETTKRFKIYYLETELFPLASFTGIIKDVEKINFNKDGSYSVQTQGEMVIHGVSQDITETAVIHIKGKQIILQTSFNLVLNNYKIRIPELLRNVFFKEAHIEVECRLK